MKAHDLCTQTNKKKVKVASVMKWKVLIYFREEENCCATPDTL